MKKNTKKLGITLFVLAVIIIAISVILTMVNNKKQTIKTNIEIVKNTYVSLSSNNSDNIVYRREILNKISELETNSQTINPNDFTKVLENYDKNMNAIQENINTLESLCTVIYYDTATDIFCRSYKSLHEEVINVYVDSINKYNKQIRNAEDLDIRNNLHNMLYTEHVDLDQDGVYRGKEA